MLEDYDSISEIVHPQHAFQELLMLVLATISSVTICGPWLPHLQNGVKKNSIISVCSNAGLRVFLRYRAKAAYFLSPLVFHMDKGPHRQ